MSTMVSAFSMSAAWILATNSSTRTESGLAPHTGAAAAAASIASSTDSASAVATLPRITPGRAAEMSSRPCSRLRLRVRLANASSSSALMDTTYTQPLPSRSFPPTYER